jgi:hypothetical protein
MAHVLITNHPSCHHTIDSWLKSACLTYKLWHAMLQARRLACIGLQPLIAHFNYLAFCCRPNDRASPKSTLNQPPPLIHVCLALTNLNYFTLSDSFWLHRTTRFIRLARPCRDQILTNFQW